jgi:subtilisin family serine protease
MKLSLALLFVSLTLINISSASIIAIVDSGNDFKHQDLVKKAWVNSVEIPDNQRDEDKNGYPDDTNGWNFAENNNQLIDYQYAYSYTEDTKRFFDVQLRSFLGTLTQNDKDWYNSKIKDETFIKNLTVFGNWMHGTHVTGIATKNSPNSKMVGIKLIPTVQKLPGGHFTSAMTDEKANPIKDALLKAALVALAQQQAKTFVEIGLYINGTHADVMNGSFGTGYKPIESLIGTLIEKFYKRKATAEELKNFTMIFFETQLEEMKKFMSAAPSTLFVFAAGNDGSNNDVYPTTPTNVNSPNKISVAASISDQSLANFSNYGAYTVDVAAPGVGIVSTIPQNHYIAVSGTSQAAPYVANIAGIVKDSNPALGPLQIKEIILGTVDVKSWLAGKVRTSGLVNRDRAIRAAILTRTMEISKAIAQSKVDILEKTANEKMMEPTYHQVPKELILPLPSPFIIQ